MMGRVFRVLFKTQPLPELGWVQHVQEFLHVYPNQFWIRIWPTTRLNTISSIAIVQLISWWDAYDHLELFKKRRDLPNVIIESIHLYVQLAGTYILLLPYPPYQTDEKSLEAGIIMGHFIYFCLTSSPRIKTHNQWHQRPQLEYQIQLV